MIIIWPKKKDRERDGWILDITKLCWDLMKISCEIGRWPRGGCGWVMEIGSNSDSIDLVRRSNNILSWLNSMKYPCFLIRSTDSYPIPWFELWVYFQLMTSLTGSFALIQGSCPPCGFHPVGHSVGMSLLCGVAPSSSISQQSLLYLLSFQKPSDPIPYQWKQPIQWHLGAQHIQNAIYDGISLGLSERRLRTLFTLKALDISTAHVVLRIETPRIVPVIPYAICHSTLEAACQGSSARTCISGIGLRVCGQRWDGVNWAWWSPRAIHIAEKGWLFWIFFSSKSGSPRHLGTEKVRRTINRGWIG